MQWLRNFGLHVYSIDEEPWVEVEVWEPFFARLAGEAWRQSDSLRESAIVDHRSAKSRGSSRSEI
jgi:hypothetical protein